MEQHASLGEFFFGAVTIGERGQVVIPAEARKRLGFQPGDKLLVFQPPQQVGLVLVPVDQVQALLARLQALADEVAATSLDDDGEKEAGPPSGAARGGS